MLLRQGNTGDDVKGLQRGLNKLGEIVLVDGGFGAATAQAVVGARTTLGLPASADADDVLLAQLQAAPDPFPPLSAPGVTFIAREEVSSAASYRQKFQNPCLPPPPSGVTIGIGYDCRFIGTRAEFEADWGTVLSAGTIDRLTAVLGQPGTEHLRNQVAEVLIPLGDAMRVFARRSLPKFFDLTRGIYPELTSNALDLAKRTALVSLVYNRGDSLDGDRRREMKAIQQLLAAGQFDQVPDQFESMTRLWLGVAAGLVTRRRSEATLWRSGFAALQLD